MVIRRISYYTLSKKLCTAGKILKKQANKGVFRQLWTVLTKKKCYFWARTPPLKYHILAPKTPLENLKCQPAKNGRSKIVPKILRTCVTAFSNKKLKLEIKLSLDNHRFFFQFLSCFTRRL